MVKVEIFGFFNFFLATETFFVKSVLTFVLLGTQRSFLFENLKQKSISKKINRGQLVCTPNMYIFGDGNLLTKKDKKNCIFRKFLTVFQTTVRPKKRRLCQFESRCHLLRTCP